MVGLDVGVLPDRGNIDICLLYPVTDCDMSRVLMTHMGFVTNVLLAPAMMDDQKLMKNWFFCTII